MLPSLRAKAIVVLASVVGAITFGAIGATGYWAFSDDMLDAARTDQVAVEAAYQDRIDRLRAEINRLTSRQAIDRESIEQQVSDLVHKQQILNERHSIVSTLMERAERSGIQLAIRNPLPARKPDSDSGLLATEIDEDASAIGGESEPLKDPLKALGLRGSSSAMPELSSTNKMPASGEQAALDKVQTGIMNMAQESTAALDALAVATETQIDTVLATTRPLGINLLPAKAAGNTSAMGGPFIPYTGRGFTGRVKRAERALTVLDGLKIAAKRLPIRRPIKNVKISSNFGPRLDPFLGKIAMHTGMDFKASYGARVYSSAPGTVIHAGRKGGYGNLVEIRHANGLTSRYAHLSRLQVSKGDHVTAGEVIGNVGSTGRSTGPHLHYEIRRGSKALNPAPFVKTGDQLSKLIQS